MAAAGDTLARALLDALDDDALDVLAERLAPRLADRLDAAGDREPDCWMDAGEAARYLGMSRNALHKLTARRERGGIPFEQDAPGGKCWFLRSELDRWRRGGGS